MDYASIDAWLADRLGASPFYEKEPFIHDLLSAVRTLLATKENDGETTAVLERAISELQVETGRITDILRRAGVMFPLPTGFERVAHSLRAISAVQQLCRSDSTDLSDLVVALKTRQLEVSDQQRRLDHLTGDIALVEDLLCDVSELKSRVEEATTKLTNDANTPSAHMHLTATIDKLQQKGREYTHRLAASDTLNRDTNLFQQTKSLMDRRAELQAEMKTVNDELHKFRQLPPDLTLARIEVAKRQTEHQELIAKRDWLLSSNVHVPNHDRVKLTSHSSVGDENMDSGHMARVG